MLEDVIGQRRVGGHHRVEGGAVAVCWPYLEPVLRALPERARVHNESLNSHRRLLSPHRQQFGVQRIQEQLQGRQPLLPVDDRSFLHRSRWILQLLEDDRAQEVRLMPGASIGEQPLRDAHDVAPQRLPLVVLVPDIRPLKQRNDQPLGLHEHHLRRADLGLHATGRSLSPDLSDGHNLSAAPLRRNESAIPATGSAPLALRLPATLAPVCTTGRACPGAAAGGQALAAAAG